MSDSLRDALERLAEKWTGMDTPGLSLPRNQDWATGVDQGYSSAAAELLGTLADYGVEPAGVSDEAVKRARAAGLAALEADKDWHKPDSMGVWRANYTRAVELVLDAAAPFMGATPDLCHNGHPFVPGVDTDMVAEGRQPDARWCNTCGEARRGATPVASRERVAEVLHGREMEHEFEGAQCGPQTCAARYRLNANALIAAGVFREPPTQKELADELRDIFVTDADPEGTSWEVAAGELLKFLAAPE